MVDILFTFYNQKINMDTRIKFIFEIIGVLLLFFVFSNLIAKYYFHTSAIELLFDRASSAVREEDSLHKQMREDLKTYEEITKDLTTNNAESRKASAVPVLVYHGVTRNAEKIEDPTEEISLDNFTQQMISLKKEGYRTITLKEFEDFINEKISLPEKSILLTFDDGIKTSYYNADPILQALGFNAVMYVITSHSTTNEKSPYYLERDEVIEMYSTGRWDIQSHGRNDHNFIKINKEGKKGHFMTNKMWLESQGRLENDVEYRERIIQDLYASKQDIESLLKNNVTSYAFPFGDYGSEESAGTILELTASVYNKYMIQFKTDKRTGYFRSNFNINPEKKLVRRIKSSEKVELDEFVNIMKASQEKVLPFESDFNVEGSENWVSSNGNLDYSISKGLLTLNASSKSASLTIFLDGSYLWKDYTVTADTKLVNGKNFSVISRAIDGNNMVVCTYNADGVTLDQRKSGKRIVLSKTGRNYFLTLLDGARVGMRVKGNSIQCLYNENVITGATTIGSIASGGIGFGVYSGTQNEAKVEISNVKVYY